MRRREFITLVAAPGGLAACGARADAGVKPQGRTAPSYEIDLEKRAAWVSPVSIENITR
jgi:hypothetical protein